MPASFRAVIRKFRTRKFHLAGLVALCIILSVGLPVEASAQLPLFNGPQAEARFVAYIDGGEHQAQLGELWARHTYRECGDAMPVTSLIPLPERFQLLTPIQFDGTGGTQPMSGAWMEGWWGKSCDEDVLLNFVFVGNNDGQKLRGMEILPGTTKTDPMLQLGAMPTAMRVAMSQIEADMGWPKGGAKDCAFDMEIKDTILRIDPSPGEVYRTDGVVGAWFEDWTVSMCGRKTIVYMGFIPNLGGDMRVVAEFHDRPI
ncbi:MAG: hypothetical protein O7C63_03545 [Alphaproteobacteria bacterium]|nr:hypothetical protein [Alphaproteobacteria bacterium]